MAHGSRTKLALVLGVALLLGAGGSTVYFKAKADAMERVTENPEQPQLLAVDVFRIVPQKHTMRFQSRGMLRGIQEVLVSAEVEGRVTNKPISESHKIQVGDIICQIDPTFHEYAVQEADAQLDAAAAAYVNAQAELKRVQDLDEEQRRPIELNRLTALRNQALAKRDRAAVLLKQAREVLKRTTIVSPINGIVSAAEFEVGELLGPARPVAEIVRLDQMKLVVDLTELQATRLGDRPRIKITSLGFPNRIFSGHIQAVYPKANLLTRRIPVEILVDNPDLLLRSGTMADCLIESEVPDAKLIIPAKVVLHEFGDDFCYLAVEKEKGEIWQVKRQAIKTIPVAGSVRWLEVIDGLSNEDLLIISHHQELRPGEMIATKTVSLNGTPFANSHPN